MFPTVNARRYYYAGKEQAYKALVAYETQCYSQEYIRESVGRLCADFEKNFEEKLAAKEMERAYYYRGYLDGLQEGLALTVPILG